MTVLRRLLPFLLAALPALANTSGTVSNLTTGKPAAGVTVTFYRFGQGGMEPIASSKTDAQGNFAIDQEPGMEGPSMLRVEVDGVTYNHIIPPGSRAKDIILDVYNASKQQPAGVKVSKHMILLQPTGGQMVVNETFIVDNSSKTAWADPANGTLKFYLPETAKGQVDVKGTAPDGMAVPVPTGKTAKTDVYTAKFEIKPGKTQVDLDYTVPYTEGAEYTGKVVTKDENTYLIAPNGITMEGTNLEDLGQEPRTKAKIYGLTTDSYRVKLTGAVVDTPAASDDTSASDSGPQIEVTMPRLYRHGVLILGLALGILALGFVVLYRSSPAAEAHERGRG